MGRILALPKQVVDMIAAGEVIERPASVVRELVENALDAGARRIEIRVEEGGKKLVCVTDDGEGIHADDLALAVVSHATSKLAGADDLFRIRTLGFRGEALPSIGAVSQLKLASRARGAAHGAVVEVRGGAVTGPAAAGLPEGTTVEVRNLFFNTPVRRRFLKQDATEAGHVTDQVTQYALAHPSVGFFLSHDGRLGLDAPPVDDVRVRIEAFQSPALAASLIPVFHQELGLTLKGYLAPATHVKPSAKSVHLFLNGRAIRDRTLLHAVTEPYRDRIPRDRYPVVYLFLQLDPKDVDVNVHPAKIEVRFRNGPRMHGLVQGLVREALGLHAAPPPALTLRPDASAAPREQIPLRFEGEDRPSSPAARVREALDTWLERRPAAVVETAPPALGPPRPTLQVHDSYLVREGDGCIEIIDQHALAERVLYDEIRPRVEREGLKAQRLLIPLTLDLDRARAGLLEGNLDLFARFGLEINRFGPSTFAVQTLPAFLPDAEAQGFIDDVLSDLGEGAASGAARRVDAVAKRLACRAAVKAGERLNEVEIRSLVDKARDLPAAPTCPHGRPAIVRIPLADLERGFQRR